MDTLTTIVEQAREGQADAFESLVRRFQDMAVGYAFSILRDFQLAEDAAQEAFFEAYRKLDTLREPAAFPGWFRRIVFKHCDRITRVQVPPIVSLEFTSDQPSLDASQADLMEQSEMKDKIWRAIDTLPEHERAALLLYHISGYSQNEVGQFLGVPVTTIKKRLFSARAKLRDILLDAFEDSLRERRPSRSEAFAGRLTDLLKAARAGDAGKVKELLKADPRLLVARDPLGNTGLIVAVNSGHRELAELLLAAGVVPDIHESAATGMIERVAQLLDEEPGRLDSYSSEGFTPLALAAHFGHLETTEFLIARGANVNAVSRNQMAVTPLHAALFGSKRAVAQLLLAHGTDVRARRGGKGWPRAGWTALHYAAANGFLELIQPLIDKGADVNAEDDEGRTPLRVAIEEKQEPAAQVLRVNSGRE